jgi:hypothetical protein
MMSKQANNVATGRHRGLVSNTASSRVSSLARYFFNLKSRQEAIPDQEGVEIPDNNLEQAITGAIEEIRAEEPDLFVGSGNWSIDVVDDQGRSIVTIPM